MVTNNTINKENVFSIFPKNNMMQFQTVNKIVKNDSVEINGKKRKSKTGKIIFGSTLASSIIGAGIIGLIFIKGGHKSSIKKLTVFAEKLGKDIQNTSKIQTNDLSTKFSISCKKGVKKLLDFLQALSNTNVIKDGGVDTILRSNKVTKPFAERSKVFFQKVVNKTLNKKYRKVKVNVDNLTAVLNHYKIDDLRQLDESQKLQKITIKGVTKTLCEWIDDLSKYSKDLVSSFDEGFSSDAIMGRTKKRSKFLSKVSKEVKDRFFKNKGFLNKENYRTYATEELSKPIQEEFSEKIIASRKKVTNNIQSIHDSVKENLSVFSENVKSDDEVAVKTIKELKQKFELFKNCSGSTEIEKRAEITDDIAAFVDDAISLIFKNDKYTQLEQRKLVEQLASIKTAVLSTKGNSKGALEEIKTILKGLNEVTISNTTKKVVTDSELKQFSKLSDKIRNGLIKATELESGEYFLKQAELEVGSAANDVLSILFPIGVGAFSIAKGEDKDEKVSAMLTTCIPLVGTFATFVYGTAKMFFGAKNLIFSGLSGVILGKLGNYCDKLYKEYRNSGSVVQVAKDEYDKFWTDITPKYAKPLKGINDTNNQNNKK